MEEDDLVAMAKLGPAYQNLGAPVKYLTATGAVAVRWGMFEIIFTGFIKILSRSPELVELGSKIPGSFNDKAKLVRKLAGVAFAHCPPLVARISDYTTRANQTCKKRNALVHGYWFDFTFFKPERGVTLSTKADGSGDFYSVKLSEIEALSVKILDLQFEGIWAIWPPIYEGLKASPLTPDELSALQAYHKSFPAPAEEAPIHRDPTRRGSPRQPEPFQA